MNFALGGIIIIVLLLPGALAQQSYYSSLIDREARISTSFNDLILQGIVWSFILHAAFICVLRLTGRSIEFNFLYNLIIGKDTKDLRYTDEQFANYTRDFISYVVSTSGAAWLLAKGLKALARVTQWNININGFRNFNYWFYIFSAKYSEGGRAGKNDTDLLYVDVMVNPEVIYCGILIDFNYSPQKDELENIVLEGAKRRMIDKDNAGVGKAIPIPGDIFVVNMKDVLNINVKYLTIAMLPAPTSSPPAGTIHEEPKTSLIGNA